MTRRFLLAVLVPLAMSATAAADPASAPASTPSPAPRAAPATPVSKALPPAARVNGVAIAAAKLAFEIERERARLASEGIELTAEDEAPLRAEVLDRLIATELIYQRAVADKIKPGEGEVEEREAKLRGQFSDAEDYRQALAAEGLTPDELREELGRALIVKKWLEREVESRVEVSDADVQAYYDRNPDEFRKPESVVARHILVRSSADDPEAQREAARKKAEAVLARLEKGESFAAVAREVSEDPGSAARGGELGELHRGEAVESFERAAFALGEGGRSGVVESPFGFHIIEAGARQESRRLALDEVRERLREMLLLEARSERAQDLVDKLRAKAKVQIP